MGSMRAFDPARPAADRVAAAALASWALAVAGLAVAAQLRPLESVPVNVDFLIMWPFTLVEGALCAAILCAVAVPRPLPAPFAAATLAGSAAAPLFKWVAPDAWDVVRILAVPGALALLVACARGRGSPVRWAAATCVPLFLAFALATHYGLMYPVHDRIDAERLAMVESVLASPDPAAQAACLAEGFACGRVDGADPARAAIDGLPPGAWEAVLSVHARSPVTEPRVMRVAVPDAPNRQRDYALVGVRAGRDGTSVAVSMPRHMEGWRLLADRYTVTTISAFFLVWYCLLFGTALGHDAMFRRRAARPRA